MRGECKDDYRSLRDLLKGDIEPPKGIDLPEIALFDRKVLINTNYPLEIDINHITACLEKDTAMKISYKKDFIGVHYWHDLDEEGKVGLNVLRILVKKKEVLMMRSLSVFAEKYPTTFEAIHTILEDYVDGQFDK